MQDFIETVIQGIGWALLKLLSVGIYKSTGSHARLFEGTIGLLAIAVVSWAIYEWAT